MEVVYDLEWTVIDGDGSPYTGKNSIVTCNITDGEQEVCVCLYHDTEPPTPRGREIIQSWLDKTDLFIAHNAKSDLSWLLECGFKVDCDIYDTMIYEYVHSRGLRRSLKLADVLPRWGLKGKEDLIGATLGAGGTVQGIPYPKLKEYGLHDAVQEYKLYKKQMEAYGVNSWHKLISNLTTLEMLQSGYPLLSVVKHSNIFLETLVEMERNGLSLDLQHLNNLRTTYSERLDYLTLSLNSIITKEFGVHSVNLNSGTDLSVLLYGRIVNSRAAWISIFQLGKKAQKKPLRLSVSAFQILIGKETKCAYIMEEESCQMCNSSGVVEKLTKQGIPYKRPPKCTICLGRGSIQTPTRQRYGFHLPLPMKGVTANGFTVDKTQLGELLKLPPAKLTGVARDFVEMLLERNAVTTYLGTFVEGIARHAIEDILHPNFNQCITATGRLSSSHPNLQNLPRDRTFPVRGAICSRFSGGSILECDYKQLEFRVAVALSGDKNGIRDVEAGVDKHALTASVLSESGQQTNRQDAKPRTFKPLYGGTSGTKAEKAYYAAFAEAHPGIAKWHDDLCWGAVEHKKISIPSGREYKFPGAYVTKSGYITDSTRIKNYPVQGFATADIVPLALSMLHERMKRAGIRSLMILTVHDCVVIDVYPGEEQMMIRMTAEVLRGVKDATKVLWAFDCPVELDVECMIGPSWLHMEEVHA